MVLFDVTQVSDSESSLSSIEDKPLPVVPVETETNTASAHTTSANAAAIPIIQEADVLISVIAGDDAELDPPAMPVLAEEEEAMRNGTLDAVDDNRGEYLLPAPLLI